MMVSRRDMLRSSLALPFLGAAAFGQDSPAFPGLIVRNSEPRNLEFPVSALRDAITPTEHFFVRSHFAVPAVDSKSWKLKVDGVVKSSLELSLDDLQRMASRSSIVTIECAGNGRVSLTPSVPGLQWGQGAVGNAEWTGVPLSAILEKAGIRDTAVEVILEGADKGQVNLDPKSPGPITYARSVPIKKASEVLLAYKMNGETLTPAHGYPLRAVVAGWYGMASVKWLTKITVTDRPFQGFWQSLDYSYFVRRDGMPTLIPVTIMQPKAIIAQPGLNEAISAGKPYRLFGAAWAGEQAVGKVDVSTDGGKSWSAAKLLDGPKPMQWVRWEYIWAKPTIGPASLVARATDAAGNTQPATRDLDRRSYMINHLIPIDVTVR